MLGINRSLRYFSRFGNFYIKFAADLTELGATKPLEPSDLGLITSTSILQIFFDETIFNDFTNMVEVTKSLS